MAVNLTIPLRVATLNVRGLGARRRQYQLSRLFLEHDLDIVAVQETKVESVEQTDRMVQPFRARYNVCVCHSVGTSGGCALFLRNSLGIVEETVTVCETGRLVVCDFSFSGSQWRAICVYAPNREYERKVFFERVEYYIKCERLVILLGDFNCVCAAEDRVRRQPVRDQSALFLNLVVQENNLEDIGCVLSHSNSPQFTHFQRDSHARLDRAYVSACLVPLCENYEVKNVSFSDHSLVLFTIGRKEVKSRFNWDLWKFNDKLLNDKTFTNDMKERIGQMLASGTRNFAELWEQFKNDVKIRAIERSCILRRQEKEKEKELQCQLDFVLSMESAQPGKFTKEIKQVKSKLELIDVERYKGAAIRARAERLWLGETPTKRSLSDEKRYASQNNIIEIQYGASMTREKELIERAFVEHYQDLLGHSKRVEEGFDREFLPLMPKLDAEVKASLEVPISLQEIERAIDELTPGKSPGPDGLGAAFYKAFKSDVAVALHRVVMEAYDKKELPPSFRKTHIVLIPKFDDPAKLLSVKSYRPISLTNVDYKVFMKVLARRLQGVISSIVGPHQTCGIKGRTIFTNIHVARSILECCDAFQGRVAMLQLDLEKAFDRVVHDVLFRILEHVNVGSVILEGVKMSYTDCFSSIIINREVSKSFQVQSSVRQGCPLSPLLFAVYLEPFCLKLLYNERIRGFRLMSSEVKVLAYADDIAVFCEDTESVREVVRVANLFCKLSGSVVNWGKCVGFWHGSWESAPRVFENIQWTRSPAKYLGVPLEHYRDTTEYWKEEIEEVRAKTLKWGGRDLSMFSRSTVCNLFIVAKVWYVLQALWMTRASVQKLHRVFAVFVWGSGWERTSRTNLFRSVQSGGLGLAHLFLRQVVARFIFLRDQRDLFLRTVLQVRLCHALPDFVVSSSKVDCPGVRGFLHEVVRAFQFLKVRFSLEYLSVVSRKRLYRDLVDVVLPEPLYRSSYCAGPGKDVLKRVKKMPVRPSVKTFFFQLHSGTLPVKPWLEEKGIFVPWSVNCLLCRKPETINHIFLDCWDAVFHWDILQRTLKKDLPITEYGIRFLPTSSEGGVPYDMFMVLSLHSMWRTRMAVRHADADARPVRDYFIESVAYIREVYKAQEEQPEWLPVMDTLVALKAF